MTFERPEFNFVRIDLDTEITAASSCVSEAQRAGLETCGCTDGIKNGATGATEVCTNPGANMWYE